MIRSFTKRPQNLIFQNNQSVFVNFLKIFFYFFFLFNLKYINDKIFFKKNYTQNFIEIIEKNTANLGRETLKNKIILYITWEREG